MTAQRAPTRTSCRTWAAGAIVLTLAALFVREPSMRDNQPPSDVYSVADFESREPRAEIVLGVVIPGSTREASASRGNFFLPSGISVHAFRDVRSTWTDANAGARHVLLNHDCSERVLRIGVSDPGVIAECGGWNALGDGGAAPVFFVIDTCFDESFGHWFVESAVFLRAWDELIVAHPSIRLVLRRHKKYKSSVLRALNIADDRVLFVDGGSGNTTGAELPVDAKGRNLVFFPPLFYLIHRAVDVDFGDEYLTWLYPRLRTLAGVSGCAAPRDVVILPRGKKENYANNENSHRGGNFSAFEGIARGRGLTVLNSDDVTDFRDQVRALARAKVVVVHYGSAFCVNSMLTRDAVLIVVEEFVGSKGFHTLALNMNFAAWHNTIVPLPGVTPDWAAVGPAIERALAQPDDATRCGDDVPPCYHAPPDFQSCPGVT